MMTKEAIRLFAEDELSSAKWLWDTCAALNADSAKGLGVGIGVDVATAAQLDYDDGGWTQSPPAFFLCASTVA